MQLQLNECKTCGGVLHRVGNAYICQACGNKWTIDAAEDVHVVDRANAWAALRNGDFDRAAELFEIIHQKEPKDHEAFWGLALACAGIMYVVDYEEHKKVPTCNNISEDSFLNSKNVKKAIELAPQDIAEGYRQQAEQIERIRTEWLQKARKEPPYDIFISYKDSDREHGLDRTQDSVDAQDLYNMLTAEGYKVFFSRISLRDKVSEHYEPYIYNALKTAKVMIVFGEKQEYFNATWVKNEWSRFKKRIEDGEKHKNSLVVVCKNMNPGDLPVVLRSRQCLNASDITFSADLLRHINKVISLSKGDEHLEKIKIQGGQISKKATSLAKNDINKREIGQSAVATTSIDEKKSLSLVESYIKEKQWEDASKLLENVLFSNPSFAEAIWCKLLINQKVSTNAALVKILDRFKPDDYGLIEKALNCASKDFAGRILDLLYQAGKSLSTVTCEKLYHLILPYRYERRTQRMKEAFDWCISKRDFTLFKLLLTGLESEEVDDYIEYNIRYIQSTQDHTEKRECTANILAVDEGNRFARMFIFEDELTLSTDLKTISDSFENVLKYSEDMDKDVQEAVVTVTGILNTPVHCKFAKQLLKYHAGDLSVLRGAIVTLANRMVEKSFFDDAQYFFHVLLSINPEDADAFWGICLAKTNSTSESQIVNSPLLLKAQAEYNKYLSLVSEERRVACMRLAKKQQQVQKSKRRKRIRVTILVSAILLAIAAGVLSVTVIIPSMRMKEADALFAAGKYEEANKLYQNLNGYGESTDRAQTVKAVFQVQAKQYDSAVKTLLSIGVPVEITFKTEGGSLTDTQALVLGHTLSLDASTLPLGNTAKAGDSGDVVHTYKNSADFSGIPDPARDGYRFVEWTTETYDYSLDSEDAVFHLTLKAEWSEKEYVIEYDLAGGTLDTENLGEYSVEDESFTLHNPTRTGYEFLGWICNNETEPVVDVTISTGSFGDRKYTAVWKALELTLNLDAAGGSCSDAFIIATYDREFTLPLPTWDGHTFLGWYDREDASLLESGLCSFTEGMDLVARWESIEYAVIYELGGGVNPSDNPALYTYDDTFTLIPPTRTGYTFKGWTGTDLSEPTLDVTVPAGSFGERTYTANWSPIQSTVILDAAGGVCNKTQVSVVFDVVLDLPTPTWEGHTFSGWYLGGTKHSHGTPCELTSDCTLVAKWDAIDYAITYNLNGGTNATGNPATYTYHDEVVLRQPQRYGYTFLGWSFEGQDTPVLDVTIPQCTTGEKTYTAHWVAISSIVTLDAAGGDCDVNSFGVTYDESFTLPEPTWTGHIFVGWYAGNTRVTDDQTWMFDGDTTLVARWDSIVYSVTYYLSGGENAVANPYTYTYHDAFTLAAPSRVGYTFTGWTFPGQDTPTMDVSVSLGTTGNLEYTANWVANGYTITLDPAGGQVTAPEISVTFDTAYVLETPTRPGYTFVGWYLGDEMVESGVWNRTDSVTLVAAWSVNTYSVTLEDVRDHKNFILVTFDHNYMGSENYVVTLTSGESLPYTYLPQRDDYLFAGWYTTADCSGEMYSFAADLDTDLILYAKWVSYDHQAESILLMNGSTGETEADSSNKHFFAFVSLTAQNITLYTSHTSGDPVLELYDKDMNFLVSDDDGYGNRDSRISWSTAAGEVYYVALSAYSTGYATVYLTGNEYPAGGGTAITGVLDGWHYVDGFDHTQDIRFDSEITLPTPSRTGYVFEGWYAGDQLVESGLWQIPADTVLTASWRPLGYTLTFDPGQGTMDSTTMEVYYDTEYTLPIPTRPGYSFTGWYNGDVLLGDGVWTMTEGLSLVAGWIENTYTVALKDIFNGIAVTYNENYVGAPVYRHYYAAGEVLTYPNIPTRDGYLFTGWYTTAACERLYDFTSAVSENVTLYAGWVQPTQAHNGTMIWGGSVEGITFTGDETLFFAFVPLKTQYVTFYTTHTGGDPILTLYNASLSHRTSDDDSHGNLDAQFRYRVDAGNVYYIALSLRESGTGSIFMDEAETPNAGGSVYLNAEHWLSRPGYDHEMQIVFGTAFTLPNLSRDGYVFNGWFNEGTRMESGIWNLPSDVILSTSWTPNTYTVTLNPNSGTVSESSAQVTFDQTVILPVPTKTGYVFQGWYYGETRVDGAAWTYLQNAELIARWAASDDVHYTVNHYHQNLENDDYVLFESTTHTGTADEVVTAPVGTYAGFISPDAVTVTVSPDGSAVVSYYYNRSVVEVIPVVNGGDPLDPISLKYGATFSLPIATRTGYTFGGWFADEALTVPYTDTTVPNETTWIYAWWTEENKPGDFLYNKNDTITIVGYIGEGTTFTVPSHIGGTVVGTIADGAFANLTQVTKIVLPVTMTGMGEGAFAGCVALEELVLPFVGSGGNYGYTIQNDENYPWDMSTGEWFSTNHDHSSSASFILTATVDMELSFEYRVSSEGNYDFLTVFHNGSQILQDSGARDYYTSFTVTLAANDTLQFRYHKDGSSSSGEDRACIRNLMAASSNSYFGSLFGRTEAEGTTAIVQNEETYYVPTSLTKVTALSMVLGNGSFENCTTLEEIHLPNLTTIGDGAFAGCTALTKLNSTTEGHFSLGAGVTQISAYAFAGCTGMESMTVEGTVTFIGERAFYGCTALSRFMSDTEGQMLLPEGLTTISKDAFRGLVSITDVVVPDSVTTIGMGAFGGCDALESITLPFVGRSENESVAQNRVLGYIFGDGTPDDDTLDMTSEMFMTGSEEGFTSQIQSGEQYYCYAIPASLTTVTVTRQTRMYAYMFQNCAAITHLYLPDQLTVIESNAFLNMAGLLSITVPGSVTEIGNGAFRGCDSLESITLPFVGRVANTSNTEQRMFGYIFGCYGANNYVEDLGLTKQYYNTSNEYYCYYIPESLRSVTIIGTAQTVLPHDAFSGCTMLTSVTLPDTMTTINSLAFYRCTNLSMLNSTTAGTFVIPAGVTHIDDYAFAGCTSMTTLVTGDALVTIDPRAFENCSALATVTLGNALENINDHAFYNCVALNKVNSTENGTLTLPSSVKYIHDYAFENAGLITKLIVPDSVVYIGRGTFKGCNALVEVTIPFIGMQNSENNDSWQYVFGFIFDTAEQNAEDSVYQNHGWYMIPKRIKTVTVTLQTGIPAFAFYNCNFIETITVPETVTRIGNYAFADCSALAKLNSDTVGTFNIPAGVTYIESYAFRACTSMTTLVTGDALVTIDPRTFENCSALATVTLGNALENINDHAFYNCVALNKVNSTTDKTLTLPNSVKTIGGWAFEGAGLITKLVVPDSVQSIGQGAFLGCNALVEVTLPFIGMENHENVNDWRYVFGYIFEYGGNEAAGCVNQYHSWYYIPRTIKNVTVSKQTNIPLNAFRNCNFIETITLPEDTTVIGAHAFYGCTKLSKLNSDTAGTFKLPDGVTVLNDSVFYDCDALTTFIPGSGLETIGTRAFYGCDNLVKFNTTQDKTIVIPDAVKTIGAYAFEEVFHVDTLVVPDSVTEILEGAFKGCAELKSLTLPFTGRNETASALEAVLGYIFGWGGGDVTQYYSSGNTVFYIPPITTVTITKQTNIPYGAFSGITTLQTVNLREDTETIGDYAFYGCTGLTGANIGRNVTSIGHRAFENNSSLVSIALPETLTTIGERAFSGCVKLNRINSDEANTLNLPDGLVSIGSHAFHNLSTVKKIVVPDSVTVMDWGVFNGCSSLVEITLPFIGWQEKKTQQPYQAVFGYIFGDNSPQNNDLSTSGAQYTTNGNDQGLTTQSGNYYYAIPKTLRTVTVTRQTSIPDYAFKNCDLLETIHLPAGATVAETAMENCSATVNMSVTPVTAPVWDGETVADGFASGSGTQDDPFIIVTPEQLVYLAQQVNAGNSFENTYFALSADILLSGHEIHNMTVIGRSADTPFAGHFDGRSHVIRNFNITGTAGDLDIGLFGYVTGSVRNLGVERATFTSTGTTLELFAGGLVAYLAEGGIMENCYSTASVTVNGSNVLHVGGLVGYNAGTVRNSYARGSVSAIGSTDAYAGGFAGNNAGVIENCFAYGGVTVHGRNAGASFSGGFVAVQTEDAQLTNCYRNEAQYLKHFDTVGAASCDLGAAASYSAIRAVLMAEGSTWAESVWDFSTILPRFK